MRPRSSAPGHRVPRLRCLTLRPRPARSSTSLLQGSAAVLDLWLREALAAGVGLAPEHWTPVLERARRSTGLDRQRLGAALGGRGLWFARHNPAWSAVVRAAEARAPGPAPTGVRDLAALAADPDRLLVEADPWSAGVARVAVEVLLSGTVPGRGARDLGLLLGTRAPLEVYGPLTAAAREVASASSRAGFAAAEEVLWVRWALAQAFDPTREPPERRPVPLAPVPGRP